ncbi:hypothetical protein V8E51_013671 [Hyaloscypha variabilis]
MYAVNNIVASQLIYFGSDEIIPDTVNEAAFLTFHNDIEPSTSISIAPPEEWFVNGSTSTTDFAPNASSAVETDSYAIQSRAKIIAKAEWERFRPIIEELYVAQELKLSTVREIMARDHGFVAAEPMYKKRIAAWNLRKNYTKQQKEEVLQHLQMEESEDILASITINKKPLKSSRLRRPVRQNGRRVFLAHQNLQRRGCRNSASDNGNPNMTATSSAAMIRGQSDLPNDKLLVRELASSHGSLSRIQLQQSPESQRVEMILRLAQSYWSSYTTRPASDQRYGFGEELGFVFNSLSNGRHFLKNNDSRAFVLLNKACFGMRTLLMAQPFRLLQQTVLGFSNPGWDMYWQIKLTLLRYLSSMTQCVFGQEHPISKTVTYLAEERDTTELISKFCKLCIDTVNNNLPYFHYATTAIDIQLDILQELHDINMDRTDSIYQQMEGLAQEKILKVRKTYVRTHPIARMALLDLCDLRGREKDFKGAERLLLELVEDTIQATGLPNGDGVGFDTCSRLGDLHRCLGNAAESVKYFRLALEGGVQTWGEDDAEVLDCVKRLELALEAFGMEEELKQLREQWKGVWERLEDELKNCSPAVSPSP